MPLTRWVVDLEDPAAGDASVVGGKAAGLHRLRCAGLPVPAAFVVTTEAFRAHFPLAAPGPPPSRPRLLAECARDIGEALAAPFPGTLPLAVRSSAAGEDGARASFAGQHETYYHVRAESLTDAIVDCWLSLWSARAQRYRAGRSAEMAMAVIVQRMLQPERSGVCFTCDPTGGSPDQLWIEASWGLGAVLVDGRVSPDRWLLDREGRILRRHVGRKRHRVSVSPGPPRQGTRLEPVPLTLQGRAVLSPRRAAQVARYSLEAERLFGTPQDVEWAYEGNRLYLLQSRPVTTAGNTGTHVRAEAPSPAGHAPAPRGDHGARWVLFKPLAENFTEPLTPLTADLLSHVLPGGSRFIDGRFYVSLDLAERLCPLRWSTAELVDVLLLRGDVPNLRLDWRKAPAAVLLLAAAYLADGIGWHRTAHLTRSSLEQYPILCHRLRTDSGLDPLQTLQRLVLGGQPFEPIGRNAFYVNVSAGRYFLLLGMLKWFVERYAAGFDSACLSRLCSGDGETWSRRLVEGVRGLAAVARQDAELSRRLQSDDPAELMAAAASAPDDHPFITALDTFLESFGHRTIREVELSVPRWREDPLPLLLMVRGYLRSSTAEPPQDAHGTYLAVRDRLRRALPRRWQWRLADYLIRRVRYYTSLREDTRHYHAMAMDVTRAKLLDLEQTLLADGRLRLPGDLFYLTWNEVSALQHRHMAWSDVAERVRIRRRHHLATCRRKPADVVHESPASGPGTLADPPGIERAASGAILTGQCASPGMAEGPVRIVLDPMSAHDLHSGDVLVAPYTDPAWTPLFPLAAAVVVEVGSFLSHAGTVAREYGVPCLVDVMDCTRRLREGQRVRVMASEGRLEVLER